MRIWLARYRTIIFILLVLAVWTAFFYFVPADALIAHIGVENIYLVAFVVSLLAGFSSLTGAAAYATVIQLSLAGADPLYLGLSSGLGIFLSDSAFFFLVMHGRSSITPYFQKLFDRIRRFFIRVPDFFVYIGAFIFSAFTPVPNDLVLTALAVAGYRYRNFWPALLLGDVALTILLSYMFHMG